MLKSAKRQNSSDNRKLWIFCCDIEILSTLANFEQTQTVISKIDFLFSLKNFDYLANVKQTPTVTPRTVPKRKFEIRLQTENPK